MAPPCIASPAEMPENWRPADNAESLFPATPWAVSEAAEAEFAIREGVAEMIALYERRPQAVEELQEDAVASLIEVSYSAKYDRALDREVRDGARRNLSQLIQPHMGRDPRSAKCSKYQILFALAIYAYNQYQANDGRVAAMADLANNAYRTSGTLEAAMDVPYAAILAGEQATSDEEVFDLVIASLLMIETQVVPGLDVTGEMRDFPPALWAFLETYPLPGADAYPEAASNETFIETAYLATHIAYIPTGNHRFPIYVEDSPALYEFHRENFYPVLEMGELDLVAEMVDSLRQYGCTPENDIQVRDGTRYLLDVFQAGQDQWMTYREPGETDADVDNYDLIHKSWTAVLGIRERTIEPAVPGNYGGIVRGWLPQQAPPG